MAIQTDILILGAGPAGVSAALYARRSGMQVTVLSKGPGTSNLDKAHLIENYYGFADPISGAELEKQGIAGAERLGVQFVTTEVMGLRLNDTMNGYIVETNGETYEAPAVVLAAGASRVSLPIPGLKELEGHGVSYCAICDAFFYRGKSVAVLGGGEYALHEAQVLLPHVKELHILTNGEESQADFPVPMQVHTAQVEAIAGEQRVSGVKFADGSELAVDGVFVALGTAGSTALARKAGAMLAGNSIKVDATMATNMPGLFAAGDNTGGLLQVAKAVYEGAQAGLSAVKYVRQQRAAK